MISGVTVTVSRKVEGGTDRFGNPTSTYAGEAVDNVLVVPGATSELEASRPAGVTVAYTLHFPKSYTASLEGCVIALPEPYGSEEGYRVIGAPSPYLDVATPTEWHMAVEVEAAHG